MEVERSQRIDELALWRRMLIIREFERAVQHFYEAGLVHGSTHLCDGQEAVAVGFGAAMSHGDYSTYTYRGHGHALARGMDLEAAFEEILGRANGVNSGKGGSMHLTDARLGLMGSFAIVGAGLPVAVGLARASMLRGDQRVSVTFFGDGAANIGAFHEALNLASVWRAPVVFVCENNLYGEFTRIDQTTSVSDIAERARSYSMPGVIVDGNDVDEVVRVAEEAIESARTGGGPALVECKTYRHRGHSKSDPGTYRPKEEVAGWLRRDPILRSRSRLLADGCDEQRLAKIESEVKEEVRLAAGKAERAAGPEVSQLTEHVYG